jgi:hypothetical protein
MIKRITDPDEIATLNMAMLEGLELFQKRDQQMFIKRKSKPAPQTIAGVRKAAAEAIENAIFEARGVVPVRDVINLLKAQLQTLTYIDAVGGTSSFHYSVSAPPSRSSVEKIADFIRGK